LFPSHSLKYVGSPYDHEQDTHIVCTFLTIEDLKGLMLCAGLSYIRVH